MKGDAGCAEEPLGPLAAALRELRAAMTDPSQYDGEDLAVGSTVCSGCPWAQRASSRGQSSVKPECSAGRCWPEDGSVVQAVTDP